MNGQDSLENATEKLNRFLESIDNYIDGIHVDRIGFLEEFHQVSNLKLEEIESKNRNELLDQSYVLCNYISYLQDKLNRNKVVLSWSLTTLNNLIAKHTKDYDFDRYTKHEIKISTLVNENSFARKIDEVRLVAESRIQYIESKIYELRKKTEILIEKAKRL